MWLLLELLALLIDPRDPIFPSETRMKPVFFAVRLLSDHPQDPKMHDKQDVFSP